ncbi:MAG: haloalkane dehalogenase [Burkholderiaceae bacterium]|jgi:pimeloyl-ACP methyl ester carboxylesterase|nr:haloalkane dehalogenase [Burkholderiaceae bacterium]
MTTTIEAVRTPDERFVALPGFPFAPHYLDEMPGYPGLRVHYLDEPPAAAASGRTVLCLHGQPTWSYLYRKMIPVFTAAGHRVVAPDFYGFGRSDKPVADAVYTFSFHRTMLLRFVEALDLGRVTLVVQDWGGLLGLTLPMEFPQRIDRLIVMNTGLGVGRSPGPGFDAWKAFVASRPDFPIGAMMKRSVAGLSDAEAAAYDAPFPDATYRAGVRRFPALVPVSPEMDGVDVSRRAAQFFREQWSGQTFMAVGMQDPVLGPPVMQALAKVIRGCPPPLELPEAGHFVQEHGQRVAEAALAAFVDH